MARINKNAHHLDGARGNATLAYRRARKTVEFEMTFTCAADARLSLYGRPCGNCYYIWVQIAVDGML